MAIFVRLFDAEKIVTQQKHWYAMPIPETMNKYNNSSADMWAFNATII